MTARIRILLANEREIIRQEIRARLAREPDFAVVGEATDGFDVGDFVARRRPDILIVDLAMAGLGGTDLISRIASRSPGTRVIVLTHPAGAGLAAEALRAGAAATLPEDAPGADLVRAVRGAREQPPVPAPASPPREESPGRRRPAAARDGSPLLTRREQEVLRLTADGLSSVEIARRLFISPRTAETHRANVMRKFGVHSRTELVRTALERGVLALRRKEGRTRGPGAAAATDEEDARKNP